MLPEMHILPDLEKATPMDLVDHGPPSIETTHALAREFFSHYVRLSQAPGVTAPANLTYQSNTYQSMGTTPRTIIPTKGYVLDMAVRQACNHRHLAPLFFSDDFTKKHCRFDSWTPLPKLVSSAQHQGLIMPYNPEHPPKRLLPDKTDYATTGRRPREDEEGETRGTFRKYPPFNPKALDKPLFVRAVPEYIIDTDNGITLSQDQWRWSSDPRGFNYMSLASPSTAQISGRVRQSNGPLRTTIVEAHFPGLEGFVWQILRNLGYHGDPGEIDQGELQAA